MTPQQQSQRALQLLKQAVLDYLQSQPDGVTNADVARSLKLESDFQGQQKNYLSWSVLGLLVNEGKVRFEKVGRSRIYFPDLK